MAGQRWRCMPHDGEREIELSWMMTGNAPCPVHRSTAGPEDTSPAVTVRSLVQHHCTRRVGWA